MSAGRILVIEDEPAIADIVTTLLTEEGYEVRCAFNGEEGLDVLREWRPDLILLDLRMPRMDGVTFRERQRQAGLATDTPLVVLSASQEAPAVAHNIGAAGTIMKPFELDDVLEEVRRATDEWRGG